MKDYEFIEHTADIGVRVFGRTLEELFKNSGCVLFSIILNYKPKQIKAKEIKLEAQTLEDLFVIWLNELISLFFADKFLPADYQLSVTDSLDKKILKAHIKGEDFNPYEQPINREVKAATYHNLKIEKTNEGFKTEIIFDV